MKKTLSKLEVESPFLSEMRRKYKCQNFIVQGMQIKTTGIQHTSHLVSIKRKRKLPKVGKCEE